MKDFTRSQGLMARERLVLGRSMRIEPYPFVFRTAHGLRLWDIDGNEYLDWMAAAAVANVGYGHPHVREAIEGALREEAFNVLACFPNEPAVQLAERLLALAQTSKPSKVWFGLSGSDAMDFLAKTVPGAAGRPRLITYIGGFAGLTLGASQISGHAWQARVLGGGHITKVPYPYPYRCPWGPCDLSECSLRCLSFVEEQILTVVSPAADTAAIILEAVQSDNGEIVPPENYLPALKTLCERHGIWLVFDEIKTGLGRTGEMFGFERSGIRPDAFAVGKPLGGGLPLSAVIGPPELLDADLFTAFTLAGSPPISRAGLAVLDVLEQEDLVENAREMGLYLMEGLHEVSKRRPSIGQVRGCGLIIGVELVKDRKTREPAPDLASALAQRCFELGLILLACGSLGNVMEITPPLTVNRNEIDEALTIFEEALRQVESEGGVG